MNGDRPSFGDAGSDAVRSLELLGKHSANPSAPVFELGCFRLVTAMLDSDTRIVT
jgi:hypothetical protein